jgi:hypothetical protein
MMRLVVVLFLFALVLGAANARATVERELKKSKKKTGDDGFKTDGLSEGCAEGMETAFGAFGIDPLAFMGMVGDQCGEDAIRTEPECRYNWNGPGECITAADCTGATCYIVAPGAGESYCATSLEELGDILGMKAPPAANSVKIPCGGDIAGGP